MKTKAVRIGVGERVGDVSGLLAVPSSPEAVLTFAHGAGAGMGHPFMEAAAERLVARGIATLRYQFPYMEAGRKRPDPPGVLVATVRAAVRAAAEAVPGVAAIAGGKSMGGRMTSQAAAGKGGLPGVRGLVFFGFPLHAPGKPGAERGDHLFESTERLLFLQGTRDAFADLDFLGPVVKKLGKRSTLHVVEGADHSFHMTKSSGRTDDEVLDELADTTAERVRSL
jgi:predicted alpha/beta-hydrolase family hydrolase